MNFLIFETLPEVSGRPSARGCGQEPPQPPPASPQPVPEGVRTPVGKEGGRGESENAKPIHPDGDFSCSKR